MFYIRFCFYVIKIANHTLVTEVCFFASDVFFVGFGSKYSLSSVIIKLSKI